MNISITCAFVVDLCKVVGLPMRSLSEIEVQLKGTINIRVMFP
jgi:hypothetical protein